MRLLPLLLSAHPSAWTADHGPAAGRDSSPSSSHCQFCGFKAEDWQEAFHCNGDHTDDTEANIVPACPLCHLAQHPERPQIDAEATLVWMPEMSQAVLNCLARGIHLTLHRLGEPADLSRTPRRAAPALIAAFRAFRSLQDRATPTLDRLGSNSFANLGAALLDLRPAAYARRAELLAGLRLLPLGQLFRNGQNIYPQMLTAWAGTREPRS